MNKWMWAAASIVTMSGCFWGLNPDEYQLACETADTLRCGGNTIQLCVDGRWRNAIPCIAQSCVDGACKGECEAGKTRCIGNAVEECVTGAWAASETCQGATCQDGACVGSCEPGTTKCVSNTLLVCDDGGTLSASTECLGQTCVEATGGCMGVCAPGQTICNGNTVEACDGNGQWMAMTTCANATCQNGACIGSCEPGQLQCNGITPELCDNTGSWQAQAPCMGQPCSGGVCAAACNAGDKRCNGNTPQACNASANWVDGSACVKMTCVNGVCQGVCDPGQTQCNGNTPQTCDANGNWKNEATCSGQTCVSGSCKGVCEQGQKKCSGSSPQTCDALGLWQNATTCEAQAKVCLDGACVLRPSCEGSTSNCGPNGNESCCLSPLIPQTTYNRSNDSSYPATISEFRLDRFEVTVGRFRKFVNAYPGSIPTAGKGAHPKIANSGWNTSWNASMPTTKTNLETTITDCAGSSWVTWTSTSDGGRERFPMNCVSWFEAVAFCIWDGGWLATEAEWNLAAAGGSEQRKYPWSNPPSSTTIDATYAVYDCTGDGSAAQICDFTDFLRVGSRSTKGDGRWGHADLGGNLWEWVLDLGANYPLPCTDCANISSGTERIRRGGRMASDSSQLLTPYRAYTRPPTDRGTGTGLRCARNP